MAKAEGKSHRVDPEWPAESYEGGHPVGEFTADRQGSLSPFGDETFPIAAEHLTYVHPVTVVNR